MLDCRWDEAKLGPFSKEKMLEKLSSEGCDTTVYTFGPGTVFGNHSHSVSKKDAILQGRFLFRMGGEEVSHHWGVVAGCLKSSTLHWTADISSVSSYSQVLCRSSWRREISWKCLRARRTMLRA